MKNPIRYTHMLHVGFEISLFIKGIDGLFEMFGGLLFLSMTPDSLNSLVRLLTLHEISEDPNDIIANMVVNMSHAFSVDTQMFMAVYLMTHGLAKIIMVYLLQRKHAWAYPFGMAFLGVFIIYQLHRFTLTHSWMMILLTVFDMVMIWLINSEYRRIHPKMHPKMHPKA